MERIAIVGGGFAGALVAHDPARRLIGEESHAACPPMLAEVVGRPAPAGRQHHSAPGG